mmetsp:Transcript_6429/g.21016  ORF Transcript_6429/g.21016 Transcript_6429/m.21016 type:complete len:204 (-) Transcript_6429:2730-3341(-)
MMLSAVKRNSLLRFLPRNLAQPPPKPRFATPPKLKLMRVLPKIDSSMKCVMLLKNSNNKVNVCMKKRRDVVRRMLKNSLVLSLRKRAAKPKPTIDTRLRSIKSELLKKRNAAAAPKKTCVVSEPKPRPKLRRKPNAGRLKLKSVVAEHTTTRCAPLKMLKIVNATPKRSVAPTTSARKPNSREQKPRDALLKSVAASKTKSET